MECPSEDVENYRMKHESDNEWEMRRSFLLTHRDKFPETRLLCLASCYINVECYNCRYPPGVMRQLDDLKTEIPKRGSHTSAKPGSLLPVKFVATEKSGTDAFSSSSNVLSVLDSVSQQLNAERQEGSVLQSSANVSDLNARFRCQLEDLKTEIPKRGSHTSTKPGSLLPVKFVAAEKSSQLEDLKTEIPKCGSRTSTKPGSVLPVEFFAAEKSGTNASSSASSVHSVPDRINRQLNAEKQEGSVLQSSTNLSDLNARFYCLVDKLREVCAAQTTTKDDADLVQTAVSKAKMSATSQYYFQCDLAVDSIHVSSADGQNKKLAKHRTVSAAAELLRKPYLQVMEDREFGASKLRLVGSDEPFPAAKSVPSKSHSVANSSDLDARFRCLADKLREVRAAQMATKNNAELLQNAVDKAKMSATSLFCFRCDLVVDSVQVSSAYGEKKKFANHLAFSAAAELLRKPFLHVVEDRISGESKLRLVGSDEPFPGAMSVPTKSLSKCLTATLAVPASRSSAQAAAKRPLSAACEGSLKDFVVLRHSVGEINPVSALQQSVEFNKWPVEYKQDETGSGCRCRVFLGGHLLGDAADGDKKAAKSAAAMQALKQIAAMCYTVWVKKLGDEDLIDALKRSEVIGGSEKDVRIPESNVGSQLLKKMGWTGGGVGRGGNKGIAEPITVAAVVSRAGLGSNQLSNFEPSVNRIISDFIRSGGHDDIVFSPEFTTEERAVIHSQARKRHLKARSYGAGSHRHLILSVQRTPLQLIEHLRAHGGETVRYSLLEPGGWSP